MQVILEKDVIHIINGVRKLEGNGVYIVYKEATNSYVGLAVTTRKNNTIIPLFNNKPEETVKLIESSFGSTVFYFTIKDFMWYFTPNRGFVNY